MSYKTIYFTDDETAYIDSQPPGYVRKCVRADMPNGYKHNAVKKKTIKQLSSFESKKIVKKDNIAEFGGGQACKKCGSILPYYGAKCKYC